MKQKFSFELIWIQLQILEIQFLTFIDNIYGSFIFQN